MLARILLTLVVSLLIGALLALLAGRAPVQPGLVGIAVMIASALVVRRRWRALHMQGLSPGSPERELWHQLATTALVAAQLATSLWLIGPAMRLHSIATHAMAIDTWTLALGALLSWQLARDPEPRADERDAIIALHATRKGNRALIALLILLAVALSFAPELGLPALSLPLVAHLLIVAMLAATLARCAAQLAAYRDEAPQA